MEKFYKYISFKSEFWKSPFETNSFWFSTRRMLDDEDEFKVCVRKNPMDKTSECVDRSSFFDTNQFMDSIEKDTSVLSLSLTSTNDHLWDRYADNHKGFCIEADLTCYKRDPYHLEPVKYISETAQSCIDDFIRIEGMSLKVDDEAIDRLHRKIYYCKDASKWASQEEVRFLVNEAGSPTGYQGRLHELGSPALLRVFVKSEMVLERNVKEMEEMIKHYNKTYNGKLEIVKL